MVCSDKGDNNYDFSWPLVFVADPEKSGQICDRPKIGISQRWSTGGQSHVYHTGEEGAGAGGFGHAW